MGTDYARIVRWCRGVAECTVNANGSRATFVSDMFFEAADAIEALSAAVQQIAAQKLADEMDEETIEAADWREGYEACIGTARQALERAP